MNRPEHRLLLACARICSEQERGDRILACLAERIDWEYLLQAAGRHMMKSLLYRHLNTIRSDAVPPGILDRLHEHYRKHSLKSLLFTAEIIRILDLFKKHGIRAIPFKGPVLAHTLYEDPETREFADLDVLVREQDVFRALKLLPDLGYEPVPDFPPYIQSRLLRNDFHYQVKKPDGWNIVEIHWNPVPGYLGFTLPDSVWLRREESVLIQGHTIPSLSCENQLTALSLHAYKHMWQSLIWINDIARLLVRYPGLNWDEMLNASTHPDLQRILFVTVLLARDFLGAPLSEEMDRRIRRDAESGRIAETIQRTYFHPETAGGALSLKRLQFRLISGWGDRFRAVAFFTFRPLPVDLKILLPRFLYPLYFILRPVGLLFRYLRRLAAGS
jgi:hypothetical protein